MAAKPIPSDDHVAKYVGPMLWNKGILDPLALLPRPVDNGEASCNWLEFYSRFSKEEDRIEQIRRDLNENEIMTLKASGRFLVLKIDDAHRALATCIPARAAIFHHEPEPGNPSHSSMTGIAHDDTAAGIALNKRVFRDYPGKL